MGRLGWLGFARKLISQQHLTRQTFCSSIVLESHCSRLRLDMDSSMLGRAIWYQQVHRYSSPAWRYAGPAAIRIPFSICHFHATGSCYAADKDYYKILGVSKNATREEIKKAFHALAKKYHPDANQNKSYAKRKFQEIRDAYETLQDTEKRVQYDMEQVQSPSSAEYSFRGPQGFRQSANPHFSDSFNKIFSEIFDNGAEEVVADIEVELSLSFSEAVNGCQKTLSFYANMPCDSCFGRGYPSNAKRVVCTTCGGLGKITIPPLTVTCSACRGLGQIVKDRCESCRGSGVTEGVKKVTVPVPTGVESGTTIHVPGGGNAGSRRSQVGSLFIKIKVEDDFIFTRDGADVYVDANISFTQAILGGKVEVPTLDGKMEIQIPKWVQPGQLMVLRGKGLPTHGLFVSQGDQYIRFCVKFPTSVNERQRQILEELSLEELPTNSRSSLNKWWQLILDGWELILARARDPHFIARISVLLILLLLLFG